MSTDTTPAELEIPDAAFTALHKAGDAPMRGYVRAVAAPVVAAELRRLAESFESIAKGSHGWVIRADATSLRARADELDPR